MTLGGLALSVGILVDEATVTMENIHRHQEMGKGRGQAIADACLEIAGPKMLILISILAVFFPALFMNGVPKAMFLPLSLSVGFSMIASFLLSQTFVPVVSNWLLKAGIQAEPSSTSRFDKLKKLAVAAAGPLSSLAIGAVLLVVGLLAGARVWPPTLFVGSWWTRLGWLNLLLGAFNLLPALPMDGGRVLRAALARHRTHLEATLVAGRVARYLGVAMVVAGFLYDVWLCLIGLFVLMGASAEVQAARRPPGAGPGAGDTAGTRDSGVGG